MPILVKGQAPPTTVECVREVRVGIPHERLDDIQRFYTLALGLVAWPDQLQIPGGLSRTCHPVESQQCG